MSLMITVEDLKELRCLLDMDEPCPLHGSTTLAICVECQHIRCLSCVNGDYTTGDFCEYCHEE